MKKIVLNSFVLGFLLVGCSSNKNSAKATSPEKYLTEIKAENLSKHLYIVASDEMEGRDTGTPGQKKAGEYLINQYKAMGISFPKGATTFYQPIPSEFFKKQFSPKLGDSENIWAFVEGSEKPDEILVISAHYDHVGMKNGEVYNGADDDGSGTVALLEIAAAFQKAKKEGNGPKRSILFLHVTGEEHGLHGSRFYAENPLFPIANTIANINIDMIGRRGYEKEDNDNYVYVIGSDRLSTDLHRISEEANTKYIGMELDYKYNDLNDPNRFYYRSDHYNFAKKGIPAIFYFNGVHDDYHKATDTPDKIDYPLLAKRTKLAFAVAWELANADERPKVDKDGK
ncbi:M28 family metallopeptidase [Flavobacterium azooxidireducens]|uniref:M28 family metallopeptidase n=1 Tax=Flavobacterium azooxidireducens TaxID=1871076 RepID=A0ABY4KF80_9FLAO|nr:M28 family metallopeptidase [Flavobacterium azooxidireducens]UPQ78956.1 M28 family metallopeptidase [Flavobacterium azooxidireducens]